MTIKFTSLVAGAAMLAFAPAAFAADMPVEQPYQAVAPVAESVGYDWSGLYVGAHGGFGWGTFDDGFGDFDAEGALAGGQIGYNMQYGQWLVGLEGDASWTDLEDDDVPGVDASLNWLATIRGRVGWTFDRVLLYGTGGVAFGDVDYIGPGGDDSQTQVGWVAGAGIEVGVTQNVSLKAEYNHVDLGEEDFGGADDVSFDADIVKAGINYRF